MNNANKNFLVGRWQMLSLTFHPQGWIEFKDSGEYAEFGDNRVYCGTWQKENDQLTIAEDGEFPIPLVFSIMSATEANLILHTNTYVDQTYRLQRMQ